MESQELVLSLLDKYIANAITPLEHNELFRLISSGEFDHLLDQHLLSQFHKENISGTDIPAYRAQKIMHKILNAEKQTSFILPGIRRKGNRIRWSIAASVIGIILFTGYYLIPSVKNDKKPAAIGHFEKNMAEKANTSNQPLKLKMEDGSFVTLQPDSKLHFPAHFFPDKREAYLEGEAFFEVSKNPNRPFFVYYNNLVTHVLGTSFHVKIDKVKKLVEVSVVTGKVQVYENKSLPVHDYDNKTNGVILTPNQKVIYKEDERQFTTTLVSNPVPISSENAKPDREPGHFLFQETPLSEVLKLLEKTYGIEMIVENDKLYTCLFNGDISKYDLHTKLDIICQSVNASYEINGTKILIKGNGCN